MQDVRFLRKELGRGRSMAGKRERQNLVTILILVGLCLALLAGCGRSTPEVVEIERTVVVTATYTPEIVERTVVVTATYTPPSSAPSPMPTPEPPTPPPLPPTPIPPPATLPYDEQADPVDLLASYINAINRGEYLRAWEYWENPPNPTYQDFVDGFADTASVFLAVRPPTHYEGAAGSVYATVPALLRATHVDASQHAFVGCYVARRPNVGDPGAGEQWSLYSADVSLAPGNSTDALLLDGACGPASAGSYEDRTHPIRLFGSYFDAVTRSEYARAWAYWENPPNPSYADFEDGYADTASVLLVVGPPVRVEGAAGSLFAAIPALMVATHTDTSLHTFVGCYTVRATNPQVPGDQVEWSLSSAQVWAAPGNASNVTQLAQACAP